MLLKFFNKSNGTCKCIVLHLKSINLVTAVFYRLPDTKTNQFLPLLKELKNVLNELHEPTPNILPMGDFNFRFIKWNTNTEHLCCVPRIPDGPGTVINIIKHMSSFNSAMKCSYYNMLQRVQPLQKCCILPLTNLWHTTVNLP